MTDERLRAMYSAARDGQSFLELAPQHLSPSSAKHVLSGKYAAAKDPPAQLAAMTRNLEARKQGAGLAALRASLADARRRGDHALARELAARAVAQRTGGEPAPDASPDLEPAPGPPADARIATGGVDTSNRKQVE